MCEKKVIEDPDPIPQVKPAYITETQKVLEKYRQADLVLAKTDTRDIDEHGRKLKKIRTILVLEFDTAADLREFERDYDLGGLTGFSTNSVYQNIFIFEDGK